MPSRLNATCAPTRKAASARTPIASAGKMRSRSAASGASDAEHHEQHDVEPAAARCPAGSPSSAVDHRARLDLGARHQPAAGRRGRVLVLQRPARGADHDDLAPNLRGLELAAVDVGEAQPAHARRVALEVDPGAVARWQVAACARAGRAPPRSGSVSSAVDAERACGGCARPSRSRSCRSPGSRGCSAGPGRRRRCCVVPFLGHVGRSAMHVRGCARTASMSESSSATSCFVVALGLGELRRRRRSPRPRPSSGCGSPARGTCAGTATAASRSLNVLSSIATIDDVRGRRLLSADR